MKNILLHTSITLFLLFLGCKDSSTGPGFAQVHHLQLTMNNGNYNSKIVEMNIATSYAIYDTTTKSTNCKFIGQRDSVPGEINISFSNKFPGVYYWRGASIVTIKMNSYMSPDQNEIWYSTSDGQTNISGYGEKGEQVSGEFMGLFVRSAPFNNDTLFISGVFDLTRFQ